MWKLGKKSGHQAGGVSSEVAAMILSASSISRRYRSSTAAADTSLEAPLAWWPDFFPPGFHLDNLRQVLLHVIAETASHAGHLDAARELIDGETWLILT